MAMAYKKLNNSNLAQEKLKEARTITGMEIDSFIKSEPYKDQELSSQVEDMLKSI